MKKSHRQRRSLSMATIFLTMALIVPAGPCLASTLLIRTDVEARVLVDGREITVVKPGEIQRAEIDEGEHIVEALALEGSSRFEQIVTVEANTQKVFDIRLGDKIVAGMVERQEQYLAEEKAAIESYVRSQIGPSGGYQQAGPANALFAAIRRGDLDDVTSLVDQGLDIDQTDANHSTPLIEAARTGQLEIAKWLLEKGATSEDVNYDGQTALWAALENNHVELIEALIASGARTDGPGRNRGWLTVYNDFMRSNVYPEEFNLPPEANSGVFFVPVEGFLSCPENAQRNDCWFADENGPEGKEWQRSKTNIFITKIDGKDIHDRHQFLATLISKAPDTPITIQFHEIRQGGAVKKVQPSLCSDCTSSRYLGKLHEVEINLERTTAISPLSWALITGKKESFEVIYSNSSHDSIISDPFLLNMAVRLLDKQVVEKLLAEGFTPTNEFILALEEYLLASIHQNPEEKIIALDILSLLVRSESINLKFSKSGESRLYYAMRELVDQCEAEALMVLPTPVFEHQDCLKGYFAQRSQCNPDKILKVFLQKGMTIQSLMCGSDEDDIYELISDWTIYSRDVPCDVSVFQTLAEFGVRPTEKTMEDLKGRKSWYQNRPVQKACNK